MQGQVAKSVLAQLGYARLLNGGLRGGASQGLGMLSGTSSSEEKQQPSSQGLELHSRIRNFSTQELANKTSFAQLRQEQQQQPLGLGLVAAASLAQGLRGCSARSPSLPMRQQVRHMNSWSAAQRYFVEGDHVVQAEINRTFQFTGLDSGSFYPFLVWTTIATAISAVFMIIPWMIAPQRVDLDKSSAYECGFDAFGEARQTFSVSFYLVSIMYLLFDIEICYLLPYVMCHANVQMFWTMNLFLSLLVVGFVYEWGVGALEWRN